jgi:NADH-quinone oxidoreductase subunit L
MSPLVLNAPALQEVTSATGVFSLIAVLIGLPLLGAAVLLLGGRRTNKWGPYLGVLTVAASSVIAIIMLVKLMELPAESRSIEQSLYTWVFAGGFQADLAFQLDQLSMVFVLLITDRRCADSPLLDRLHVT